MMRTIRALALCPTLLALFMPSAWAEAPLYRGEYALSFLGLRIARIDFDSRIDSERYSIEGKVASAGLGAFFYDTRGTLTAKGSFKGERITYGVKEGALDIVLNDRLASRVPPEARAALDKARADIKAGTLEVPFVAQ